MLTPIAFRQARVRALMAAAALLAPAAGLAQDAATQEYPRPTVVAVRVSQRISLDGVLDEPAWSTAVPATDFYQVDPEEGRPASERTEVRIVYDSDNLYIGAFFHDHFPVTSHLARRDVLMYDSDKFLIAFDSYHDGLTAYRFHTNPDGVRRDTRLSGGQMSGGDVTWDPVWDVKTTVSDSGWVAEIRIPFSQIPFAEGSEHIWGIQMERYTARRPEEAWLAFVPKTESQSISRYGQLLGLKDIRRGGGFEVLPYATTRADYAPLEEPRPAAFANPFRGRANYIADAGVDLKYRVASNLTLDATVNPDFGQVEVDPAVVNLTAFETRFHENRPFFVEGSEVFQFGGDAQLLYSRRIGGPPTWKAPSGAAYTAVPEEANILQAGKLTGRTAGGWNIGVLEAVTAKETAHYVDGAGVRSDAAAAPLSGWFAARVQRTFGQGRTSFGGIATAVERRLGGLAIADQLRGDAYAAGLDFSHQWRDRRWLLSGYAAGSRIGGRASVITAAQRSSARYYQRPDAEHLELDANAMSLAGYTLNLEIHKQAGGHWRGTARVTAVSPGLEINDVGFQLDADRIAAIAQLRYQETMPGSHFRSWNTTLQHDRTWNYGRDLIGSTLTSGTGVQLNNYWNVSVNLSHGFASMDDRLTRGGPLARTPSSSRVLGSFSSDRRKTWRLGGSASHSWNGEGASLSDLGSSFIWQPAPSWSVELGPHYTRERSLAQYVGSVADPVATSTFGRRHLFSGLDQSTVYLNTRLNITFKPGLTLELFGQPFVASADFDGLKELRAPATFSFLRYGQDAGTLRRDGTGLVVDPDGTGPAPTFRVAEGDFNRRSLKGNVVLRWEWRAGSTLFLVWQHARAESEDLNDLRLGRDLSGLFSSPSRNILAIKMSYWFSP